MPFVKVQFLVDQHKKQQIQKIQMSKGEPINSQYLDAKSIPKFEFQLVDQELINCIKELYLQSKSQQKVVAQHKKQLQQKVSIQQLIDSFKLLETNISLPTLLQNLVSSNGKNKDFNDPTNPVLTSSIKLSNKLAQFVELFESFNNKISSLEKRIVQSEQKTNLNFKEKVSSLEEQLNTFVKDYRNGFKSLNDKFEETKLNFETKAREIETNTLWKINQCSKRLEERPNVEMVKSSVLEVEKKLTKMIESGGKGFHSSGSGETTKIEQDLIKLKKLVDFNTIETQSQTKALNQRLQTSFMSLKSYADQKIQITKRFENIMILNADLGRNLKSQQTKLSQALKNLKNTNETVDHHNQQIKKINENIEKFTKADEFAKLLQKIDPHELCRISSILKGLQEKSISTDRRLDAITAFTEALRSKMEFWNVANGENPEKNEETINLELISKLIKEEINGSDFKTKMLRFEQQLIDLMRMKEGINDMIKKISRVNKDNDLTNVKYEIQGCQEYIKREVLILSNRITSLESALNNANDSKKRPLSARGKDEGKMFASLSTKKLLPVNCISCHQTNTMMVERDRKTVFNSKLIMK